MRRSSARPVPSLSTMDPALTSKFLSKGRALSNSVKCVCGVLRASSPCRFPACIPLTHEFEDAVSRHLLLGEDIKESLSIRARVVGSSPALDEKSGEFPMVVLHRCMQGVGPALRAGVNVGSQP